MKNQLEFCFVYNILLFILMPLKLCVQIVFLFFTIVLKLSSIENLDEVRIVRIEGCVRSITSGKDWVLDGIIDRVVDEVRNRDRDRSRDTTMSNSGAVDRDDGAGSDGVSVVINAIIDHSSILGEVDGRLSSRCDANKGQQQNKSETLNHNTNKYK